MNIDNMLMLGIVFLTAGVAMALLAYAALLNRRSGEDEIDEGELPLESEGEAEEEAPEAEDDLHPDELETVVEPEETVSPPEPPLPSPPLATGEQPTLMPTGTAPPENAEPHPRATLLRDEQTGRLAVQVGDSVYRSIENLRESEDWQRVDHLFSDLLAWMVRMEAQDRAKGESSGAPEPASKPSAPLSMVEQINEILSAKLANQPDKTKAVHLLEGPGGSIRVYIGVNSYSIEEVPDENVRSLIREAVKEWESQQ